MGSVSTLHWPVVTAAPRFDAERPRQPLRAAVVGSLLAHALAFALLPPFSTWHIEPPTIPVSLRVTLGSVSSAHIAASKPAAPRNMPATQSPAAVPVPAKSIAPHTAILHPQPNPASQAIIATSAAQSPRSNSVSVPAEPPRSAVTGGVRAAAATASEKSAADSDAAEAGGSVAAVIRPGELSRHVPAYPFAAKRREIEGTVTLKIEVLPNGEAGRIEIAKSSGDDSLDEAARDAAKLWHFSPAKKGDKAVTDWARVSYSFKLAPQ